MSEETWRLHPIGAVVVGPPPVRHCWVPIETGVHALYGLNGAGKTRLLTAVADIFSGSGAGFVVAEARLSAGGVGDGVPFWIDQRQVESDWRSMAEMAGWRSPGRSVVERAVGDAIWERLEWLHGSAEQRSVLLEEIDEVVGQRLFALTPMSSQDGEPEWHVTPAVRIEASTPRLLADCFRLFDAARAYETAANDRGFRRPYDIPDDLDDDELETLFAETMSVEGLIQEGRVGGTLLTSATWIFEGIRDPWPEEFERELRILEEAALIPVRLGGNDGLPSLATVSGPLATVIRNDQLSADHVLALTVRAMTSDLPPEEILQATEASAVSPGGELIHRVMEVSFAADDWLRAFMAEAPELELDLGEPTKWLVGNPFTWEAIDRVGSRLRLSDLSEANRRWALIAIAIALADLHPEVMTKPVEWWREPFENRPVVVALDEPDGALHATAERHAIRGLLRVASELDAMVICSTHSREFLNSPDVQLRHVTRDVDGHTVVHRMTHPTARQVHELGIGPADLFLLHRLILVVEGAHDESVIRALIGDELDRRGVLVMPTRGGRLLSTAVDAHVLSLFSDAPVVAALDNVHAHEIQRFWDDLSVAGEDGPVDFDEVTKRHFSSKRRDEETFFINYCRAAVENGSLERFRVFGFSKPDIPEYLPVEALVPQAESWEQLRSAFEDQSKFRSFKPWLRDAYGVEYTLEDLEQAAARLDHLPDDFVELISFVDTVLRPATDKP